MHTCFTSPEDDSLHLMIASIILFGQFFVFDTCLSNEAIIAI